MHHQDYTGDSPGASIRKTAFHHRRGSSGSAPGSPSSSVGGVPLEESQTPAQAGSAQVKKKSGFQITSVTLAQTNNVSGNNSMADDTESYDDMDESHTEDLSSSELLDISASRAADTGVPERSSSDETLNNLPGVDTPGLVSPNEPLQLHHVAQGSSFVNGSVHQQHYPQTAHHLRSDPASSLSMGPIASSSPAMSHRPVMQDNPKPAAIHMQSAAKAASVSASGSDNTNAGLHSTQSPHIQANPGSRFRVVKLDSNLEPFRKGRWTCTEYYEKEVLQPSPSEPAKAMDVAAEADAGINAPIPPVQLPPKLQLYHPPPPQDFTSPQTVHSTTQNYVPPQEVVGTVNAQQPVAPPVSIPAATSQPPPVLPQPVAYNLDPQARVGYPTTQLHAGMLTSQRGVRQPDFIQPTAPFQTQVQPPLPHANSGISAAVPGFPLQHPTSICPQQPAQTTVTQPPQKAKLQHPSAAAPTLTAGAPCNPLNTLQADLQPLLNLGANLANIPAGGSFVKNAELENAQKFLIQHQGLLGLPRLASARVGEGAVEGHIGMSVEARAFMAAAGFRSQQNEGENDSSSGASVVAIDNKIEQAMDLVKSHLMYAVREEVEVLKEQIKELMERNNQLEQENNLLKTLASPEQMAQFQAQVQTSGSPTGAAQPPVPPGPTQVVSSTQNSGAAT
ncbi:PREDICTED: TSC22 domain family protein 1 isoform X1 [Cyprinodon variegatus]|uniref:TSC22 domain family protein 1 n=1 Tax=Cyprinodon variegatus TaxID=28743 RepID=A0A3Q2DH76_CYPVA|nr:PREDICTED: TSC22 domain family protein 1 isoform X1 [Cyprinodon variegatus]